MTIICGACGLSCAGSGLHTCAAQFKPCEHCGLLHVTGKTHVCPDGITTMFTKHLGDVDHELEQLRAQVEQLSQRLGIVLPKTADAAPVGQSTTCASLPRPELGPTLNEGELMRVVCLAAPHLGPATTLYELELACARADNPVPALLLIGLWRTVACVEPTTGGGTIEVVNLGALRGRLANCVRRLHGTPVHTGVDALTRLLDLLDAGDTFILCRNCRNWVCRETAKDGLGESCCAV